MKFFMFGLPMSMFETNRILGFITAKTQFKWSNFTSMRAILFPFHNIFIMMISVPASICHWTWIGNWSSLLSEQMLSTLVCQLLRTKLRGLNTTKIKNEATVCVSRILGFVSTTSLERNFQNGYFTRYMYTLHPNSWQRNFYPSISLSIP